MIGFVKFVLLDFDQKSEDIYALQTFDVSTMILGGWNGLGVETLDCQSDVRTCTDFSTDKGSHAPDLLWQSGIESSHQHQVA